MAKAVWDSVNDPEFVAWGKKVGRPVAPLNAGDATKLVGQLFSYYVQYKDVLAASNKKTR